MSGFRGEIVGPNPKIEVAPAGFLARPIWKGIFTAEVWSRKRKSGLREFLRAVEAPNGVTNGGIEDNESVYFAAGTQKTAWYFGLVNNSGWTAFAAADTMSSHAGWTELASYDEATRPQWSPGAPSGRTITNPTSATFTISATVAIKGAFLVSNNTKSGTSGTLWSTGAFSTVQNLVDDQVFKLTYTLTGTSS